jgi:hypothetical protein
MEFDWRPDSGAIVFSASIDFHKQADRFDTKDLYLVESDAKPPAPTLLVDAQTNDRNPVFSPDGRYLAWHAVWCCWGDADAEGRGTPQAQLPAGYPDEVRPAPELPRQPDPRARHADRRDHRADGGVGPAARRARLVGGRPRAVLLRARRGAQQAVPDRARRRAEGGAPTRLADMPGSWGRPVVAGTTVLAAHQRTTRPPELFAIDTRQPRRQRRAP